MRPRLARRGLRPDGRGHAGSSAAAAGDAADTTRARATGRGRLGIGDGDVSDALEAGEHVEWVDRDTNTETAGFASTPATAARAGVRKHRADWSRRRSWRAP